MRDAPPIFFLRHQKENAPRPVEKKKCLGGSVCAGADLLPPAGEGWQSRAAVRDGNARPLGNPSARGCPGYIQLLFSLPLAVVDESLRSGPMRASASTTARAARSEAERAERESGQMRPCTPIFVGTAPRESVFKSAPYSAAPVGKPSQTRRHHLTPTPVQQLCTHVQSCDQKRFFLFHRARRILFLSRTKREWGAHPPWKRPPGGSQSPRAVEKRLYTSAGGISGTEKRNLS